jgi:hypothetical protein
VRLLRPITYDHKHHNFQNINRVSLGPHFLNAAYPTPNRNCTLSKLYSINKRISAPLPVPNFQLLRRLREFVKNDCVKRFGQIPVDADLSVENWLAHCNNYTLGRKTQLKNIYETFRHDLYNLRFAKVKCFIKDEAYPEYKSPRGIMSRSDQFKVLVGPVIKQIEEVIYKNESFIKHVPIKDRPDYINRLFSRATKKNIYSGDYTAFESHFVKRAMQMVEFIVYDHVVANNPQAKHILKHFKQVVSSKQKLVYSDFEIKIPESIRCSGEMTTSVGNGLANFYLMLFLSTLHGDPEPYIIVEGDDSLVKTNADLTDKMFANLGFTIKLEKHTSFNTASFCGIIFDFDSLTNIIDPIKTILKSPWASYKYAFAGNKILKSLLRAKALSLAHQNPGCPIVDAYSKYLLRMTNDVNPNFNDIDPYELARLGDLKNIPHKEVQMSSRSLMFEKFNIPIEHQLYIENLFNNKDDLLPFDDNIIISYCNSDQLDYARNYQYQVEYVQGPTSIYYPIALTNQDCNEILQFLNFNLKKRAGGAR